MRDIQRRQFGAMLATATFSLGGLGTAVASGSETEPLELEDVSVNIGTATASISQATFAFQDGTMQLELSGWTMESAARSLAIEQTRVAVDEVDEETFVAVRSAMVEAFTGRSVSPLLAVVADGTVPGSAPLRVSAGPVEVDGQTAADRVTATGTVGEVVPEGTQELAESGLSLRGLLGLGSASWNRLIVQRGNAQLALNDVVMQREGASFVISAPGGKAELPGRTLDLTEVTMTLQPPETIPEDQVSFAAELRQSAAEGSVSSSEIESAAAESGVSVADTADAVESARFDLSLGEVSESGEVLVSNFQTSGTLAELMQVLQTRV